jgi:hypothetical protein
MAHYEAAKALFAAERDEAGIARVENNLGNIALASDDPLAAEQFYRAALHKFAKLGDRHREALLCNNLALALLNSTEGGSDELSGLLERSIGVFRGLGDARETARALETKALVLDARGEHRDALPIHLESATIRYELGDDLGAIISIEGLAGSLAYVGRPGQASRVLGHVAAVRAQLGEPRERVDEARIATVEAYIRARLPENDVARERAAGAAAPLDDVLAMINRIS